jgi:hypothetical protein
MRRLSLAVAALLALGGCSTGQDMRITRFHRDRSIARGQIAVEPIRSADRGSLEFQAYASIVGGALARVGFTEAPGLTPSDLIAAITVAPTRLIVRIERRSDGTVIWEGRAETGAAADPAASVQRLAAALFRDFPGASGRTITVR